MSIMVIRTGIESETGWFYRSNPREKTKRQKGGGQSLERLQESSSQTGHSYQE